MRIHPVALFLRLLVTAALPLENIANENENSAKRITCAFAADARYLPKLLAVVERLRSSKLGKSYRLIAYNLNSAPNADFELLQCAAPTLLDEIRQFPFQEFPSHVAKLNCYAWKPLLLARLRREFPSSAVVWLDSGLTFGGGHSRTFLEDAAAAAARSGGVVSDHTARTLEDFTHQGMFQYFEKTWGLARSFFTTDASEEVLNCNGAFSAWESQDDGERGSGSGRTSGGNGGGKGERSVSQRAMDMWEQCALDARCICPAGSSRANHRQDQAALTLVLAANGKRCYGSAVGSRGPFGNATDWVHAHGLRMKSVLCQDARCFVEKHAPACLLRKKEAEATKRIRQ